MQQPKMVQPQVVVQVQKKPMAHRMPNCYVCHGSGYNPHNHQVCHACVCTKCGGSGWNHKKNKPCKKLKVQGGYKGGHGGKKWKKYKKHKGFKKFKLKKLF